MKRMLFLYNMHAGKRRANTHVGEILDVFTHEGWLVTVHPTQGKADATATCAQMGSQFDRVVCCGGDGTLHEVVEGVMGLEVRPEIGYIPAGSTNDFARNLSLPKGFRKLAQVAAAGRPCPYDIGRFNDRYFVYVAAFGAFTDIAYSTPQRYKNAFGHLAYLVQGVGRLSRLKSYHLKVEYDDGQAEGDFIFGMVSNTVSVGGFKGLGGKNVSLDDGVYEVMLIRPPEKRGDLGKISQALFQQKRDEYGPVTTFHTSRLVISCDQPLSWTLDGEYGGAPNPVVIENQCKAVTILRG